MSWLEQLLFDTNSIAHILLLYTAVISLGVYLGKIKVFGISLGVTFVLFAGILAGHLGLTGTLSTLNFIQDFGLILFVYCIGLQVGPGFFESFKKGGITLNALACGVVALNILVMLVLYLCFMDTSDPTNLPMMVGANYWNQGVGRQVGDVLSDEEGLETMRVLGKNMAKALKSLNK